jgi:hypothetical protein
MPPGVRSAVQPITGKPTHCWGRRVRVRPAEVRASGRLHGRDPASAAPFVRRLRSTASSASSGHARAVPNARKNRLTGGKSCQETAERPTYHSSWAGRHGRAHGAGRSSGLHTDESLGIDNGSA